MLETTARDTRPASSERNSQPLEHNGGDLQSGAAEAAKSHVAEASEKSGANDASEDPTTVVAAPTAFRVKAYNTLTEAEKWQFADACANVLVNRIWDEPADKFNIMKKATEEFLDEQYQLLKEKEALQIELFKNQKSQTLRI